MKKWFHTNKIRALEWPSQLIDLNPIEDLWKKFKFQVHQRNFKNLSDLKAICQQMLHKIGVNFWKNRTSNYSKHPTAVISNNEYAIKYWILFINMCPKLELVTFCCICQYIYMSANISSFLFKHSVMNNQEWSPLVLLLSSSRELFLSTGTIKRHYMQTLYSQLNKVFLKPTPMYFCHYN